MIRTIQGCVLALFLVAAIGIGSANAISFGTTDFGTLFAGDVRSDGNSIDPGDSPLEDTFITWTAGDSGGGSTGFLVKIEAEDNEGPFNPGNFLTLGWEIITSDSSFSDSGTITDADLINPVTLSFALAALETVKISLSGPTGSNGGSYNVSVAAVPIPAAGLLFGGALAGIGFLSRRRRKKTLEQAAI